MISETILGLQEVLSLHNLMIWVAVWSLVGFAIMGYDKLQAVFETDRISERTLHEIAVLGGFIGIMLGAEVFHHKTSKLSFWRPVLLAALLWAVLFVVILRYQPQNLLP